MSDPKDIWEGLGATNFSAPQKQEPAPVPQPSAMEFLASLGQSGPMGGRDWLQSDPREQGRMAGSVPIVETANDAAVGFNQGLSSRFSDEFMSAMPGTNQAEQQSLVDEAYRRSPNATPIGEAAGSAVQAAAMSPIRGTSMLAGAADAAVQGGLAGFGGAEGDVFDRTGAGLKGAGAGFVASPLFQGATRGLGAIEEWASLLANKLRMNAFSTPGKFAVNARQEGLEYTRDELAQEAERLGLTNKFIPQSPEGFEKRVGAAKQAAGAMEGAGLDAAAEQGIRGDRRVIQEGLGDLRHTARTTGEDRQSVPPIYDRMIGNIEEDIIASRDPSAVLTTPGSQDPWSNARGPDRVRYTHGPENAEMTPRDILGLKKTYEEKGGFPSKEIKTLPLGLEQTAYQNASAVPREHLQDVMREATPEAYDNYHTGRGDFRVLAALENLAKERSIHNDSHGLGVVPSSLFSAGGLAAGMSMGGGPLEAVAGAATGYAAGQANRTYGPDAAANTMRAFEHLAGGGANFSEALAPVSGQAAGRVTGDQQRHERERASNVSKGHQMQSAVSRALQTDPSVLGEYAQQFAEAQQDPDPMVMTALISELNEDPKFRMTVMHKLQRMSNPQGDY